MFPEHDIRNSPQMHSEAPKRVLSGSEYKLYPQAKTPRIFEIGGSESYTHHVVVLKWITRELFLTVE